MFNATPTEDRLRSLREFGDIENEIHFMFCCPVYENIRGVLFSQMPSICDNFFGLHDDEKT